MKKTLFLLISLLSISSLGLAQGADLKDNFTIAMYQTFGSRGGAGASLRNLMGYNPSYCKYAAHLVADSLDSPTYGKYALSCLPAMKQDGFTTVLYYFPDYTHSSVDIETGFKGLLLHTKNCGLNAILDFKIGFHPDTTLMTSKTWFGGVDGEFVYDFQGIGQRPNLKNLFNLAVDTTYGNALAGIQLSEEPSAQHVYSGFFLGPPNGITCYQSTANAGCYSCSVPPSAISDAVDTFSAWFANANVEFPLMNCIARHNGIIDSFTIENTSPHSPYLPQHYVLSDSTKTLPSTIINSSYYIHDHLGDTTQHRTSELTGPPTSSHRTHYLGRYKTLDFLRPRVNNVLSGIQINPWEGGFFNSPDWAVPGSAANEKYYGGPNWPFPLLNLIHTDTVTTGGVNQRNGNVLWFQTYNSIIHGTNGVIFWFSECWSPTYEDSINRVDYYSNSYYPGKYNRDKFPSVYRKYVRPLTKELSWLSKNNLIGRATTTLYSKTTHEDLNCVVEPAANYLNSASEIPTSRRNEEYGLRYVINTNGDDVVMIVTNPLPNNIETTLDFSNLANTIIQRSDSIEVLFTEEVDPNSSTYKSNRTMGVDFEISSVIRSQKLALTNGTIDLELGPLDVVVFKFIETQSSSNYNTQANHLNKIWDNYGDGEIGHAFIYSADTFYIGDFLGNGAEQLLVVQTGSNASWLSLHTYNSVDNEWIYYWSNNGNSSDSILLYKSTLVPGRFENTSKDFLLGFDPVTGKKQMFEFNTSSLEWESKYTSTPTDHIEQYYEIYSAGDYNGDGYDEVIAYSNPGWTTEFKYDGTDFIWGTWSDTGAGDIKNYRDYKQNTGDFDGDGSDEILAFNSNSISLFKFDSNNFTWDSVWSSTSSLGGWGYPFSYNSIGLVGDIDAVDNKDELMLIQIGSLAGWATSFDLDYAPLTGYSWLWNYSANPVSNIPFMRDWSIADGNGSETEYYFIKAEASEPSHLLTRRKFKCNSDPGRYHMAMYETQSAYNYKIKITPVAMPKNDTVLTQVKSPSLLVYPNPTDKIVNVKSEDPELIIREIELQSAMGETVGYLVQNGHSSSYKIDLRQSGNIQAGTYLLLVRTTSGVESFKLVVY